MGREKLLSARFGYTTSAESSLPSSFYVTVTTAHLADRGLLRYCAVQAYSQSTLSYDSCFFSG